MNIERLIKFNLKASKTAMLYFEKKKVVENDFFALLDLSESKSGYQGFYKQLLGAERNTVAGLPKVYVRDVTKALKMFRISLLKEGRLSYIFSPKFNSMLYITKAQEGKYEKLISPDSKFPDAMLNEGDPSCIKEFKRKMCKPENKELAELLLDLYGVSPKPDIRRTADSNKLEISDKTLKGSEAIAMHGVVSPQEDGSEDITSFSGSLTGSINKTHGRGGSVKNAEISFKNTIGSSSSSKTGETASEAAVPSAAPGDSPRSVAKKRKAEGTKEEAEGTKKGSIHKKYGMRRPREDGVGAAASAVVGPRAVADSEEFFKFIEEAEGTKKGSIHKKYGMRRPRGDGVGAAASAAVDPRAVADSEEFFEFIEEATRRLNAWAEFLNKL